MAKLGFHSGVPMNAASLILAGGGGLTTASFTQTWATVCGVAGMVIGLGHLIWGFTVDGEHWWSRRRIRMTWPYVVLIMSILGLATAGHAIWLQREKPATGSAKGVGERVTPLGLEVLIDGPQFDDPTKGDFTYEVRLKNTAKGTFAVRAIYSYIVTLKYGAGFKMADLPIAEAFRAITAWKRNRWGDLRIGNGATAALYKPVKASLDGQSNAESSFLVEEGKERVFVGHFRAPELQAKNLQYVIFPVVSYTGPQGNQASVPIVASTLTRSKDSDYDIQFNSPFRATLIEDTRNGKQGH